MPQSIGNLLSVSAVSDVAVRKSHAAASGQANQPRHRKEDDPVVAKVRAWMAEKDAQDALQLEWQDAEKALCRKIKPFGMSLTKAARGRFPEAERMRALMKRIRAADRRLDREAGRIVTMKAMTPHGALAKIEMALRIQEPLDCEEYTWALLKDGFERLRELI